jgi:hypothetical protein
VSVVVVTGEDDSFCLCLCLYLCLVRGHGHDLCLCRRVGDGNDLVRPLALADLHIACHL